MLSQGTSSLLASHSTDLHATFETYRLIIVSTAIGQIVSLFSISVIKLVSLMYFGRFRPWQENVNH